MKRLLFLLLFVGNFLLTFSQTKVLRKADKPNINLKETYAGNNNLSEVYIKDTLLVYIYFPKKLFSIQEVEKILSRGNHLMEVSSQSIVQKSNCTETVITATRYLSSCWIKDPNPNAKSVVAAHYNLVKGSNEDYHTIRATIAYGGLAPKTALVSVFLEKHNLENIRAGNWYILDKTVCYFNISEERWPEFVFQAGGCCVRGFAVRGNAGGNSICSTIPRNVVVEFWVTKSSE